MTVAQNPFVEGTPAAILWKIKRDLPISDEERRRIDWFQSVLDDAKRFMRADTGNSRLQGAHRHVVAALAGVDVDVESMREAHQRDGVDPARTPVVYLVRHHLIEARRLLEQEAS